MKSLIINNGNRFTLGFSPCPNDCFIFDAMIQEKIDTEGLVFDVVMEDVEALNKRALLSSDEDESLDVTKLSFASFLFANKNYSLLQSGSALGFGVGPLVVAKKNINISDSTSVAIPGINTTANFLFTYAYPKVKNKVPMLFSEIEQAVFSGKVDAGVIIHENRFTFEQKGLTKIIDLGNFWEEQTKSPIPLGGIVIKRKIPIEQKEKINRVIKRSVEFAISNPQSSLKFVKQNAQEMSEEVMYKHIELYVNKFSVDLGEVGRDAVKLMFNKAVEIGLINNKLYDIFE